MLYIKLSMASDKVCVAVISPDDLAFVLKVSEAGIHLTA